MSSFHQPVLLKEVLEYLNPEPNQNFIDCTVGGGGHAQAILEKTSPKGKLLGIDRDPVAIEAARENLSRFKNRIILIQDSYKNIDKIIYGQRLFLRPRGILLDLGFSSYQVSLFDQRGFSFQKEALLDMRFGPDSELTAEKIINQYSERELAKIFKNYGEEEKAKLIAKQIILFRKKKPIKTTFELVKIVERVKKHYPSRIHPATKIFQALRMAVNQELEVLEETLPKLIKILTTGGRLVVISFHSLENMVVKRYFNQESQDCLCSKEIPLCICQHQKKIKLINKKVIIPTIQEIKNNPRSRSAKMRVVEKI